MQTTDRTRTVIYISALLLIFLSIMGSGQVTGSSLISAYLPEWPAPQPAMALTQAAPDTLITRLSLEGKIRLHPERLPAPPPRLIDEETLWLARCIYSETKRPEEQELIAWVVRNRVEVGYRGNATYHKVILDPLQFSAFNPDSPWLDFYSSLDRDTPDPGWQKALSIAHYVRHARPQYRPFPILTLHFYSEQSMVGRREPRWIHALTPVDPPESYQIDERRFRFFAGIS